jgi:hypothetical protein|tara:strand:+ start:447 stop:770 length:324 start_codon:yes stop_codon:yes gene_type:complete
MRKLFKTAARPFRWASSRILHKINHFSLSSLKKAMKENGLALVVIILLWEVIEDILFPLLFIFLGNHVHPAFYAGAPASWLLCVHWLAVPIMWKAWMSIKKRREIED